MDLWGKTAEVPQPPAARSESPIRTAVACRDSAAMSIEKWRCNNTTAGSQPHLPIRKGLAEASPLTKLANLRTLPSGLP